MNKAYLQSGRCTASDECLTPRYGVLPIIPYLKKRGFKKIWCPFDLPSSWYARALRAEGFAVRTSHIQSGEDFFTFEPKGDYDCIVSNPPYSCKDLILKRLYALEKPFAILLPQNSLQGIARVGMFKAGGIKYMGFDRRINFYTRGELDAWKPANHFATGYFCKGVLYEKLCFKNLKPIQEPYHAPI